MDAINLTASFFVRTAFFHFFFSSGTGSFDAKVLATMSATERQRQVQFRRGSKGQAQGRGGGGGGGRGEGGSRFPFNLEAV